MSYVVDICLETPAPHPNENVFICTGHSPVDGTYRTFLGSSVTALVACTLVGGDTITRGTHDGVRQVRAVNHRSIHVGGQPPGKHDHLPRARHGEAIVNQCSPFSRALTTRNVLHSTLRPTSHEQAQLVT